VFFGASVTATRFVVAEIDPLTLAFLRYLIGALCLIPFVLTQRLHSARSSAAGLPL
jgi:drug/metabolite transporter (DMT)-like permease